MFIQFLVTIKPNYLHILYIFFSKCVEYILSGCICNRTNNFFLNMIVKTLNIYNVFIISIYFYLNCLIAEPWLYLNSRKIWLFKKSGTVIIFSQLFFFLFTFLIFHKWTGWRWNWYNEIRTNRVYFAYRNLIIYIG